MNRTDGKPVAGAGVFLINASAKTSSAADGTFTLPNLATGKYSLAVSAPGFQVANQEVTIGNANVSLGDIFILSKAIRDEKLKQDSDVAKTIVAGLKKYNTQRISEKVYLHFDKPYYAAGDTIYFKAYLTVGQGHHLSGLSGILYVDLVNGAKQIVQSNRLEVIGGVAWGDFTLPDSIPTQTYRVRAYTKWMRNDGEQAFFDQAIPVGAVMAKIVPLAVNKAAQTKINEDIQFFPEGGSMVTGIKSKIAFKAIDSTGFGVFVKGSIVDKENNEVASFSSVHLGMGSFYLKPVTGESYKAKVTYPDGKQMVTPLPDATDNGMVLSVKNDSTPKTTITIKTGSAFYSANQGKNYTIVVYASGKVIFFDFTLDNPGVGIDFSKTGLATGVASVTLFSPSGEPLAERLFFIKNPATLKLDVSSDKANYSKRERATLTLKTTGADGNPAQGHFSAAVIDESRVPFNDDEGNSIFTNLLLTSELKGYVEQPNYYFVSDSSKRIDDLDLLMLTQGYRSFEWKQILTGTEPEPTYQPERLFELSGTAKTTTGEPAPGASVTLLASQEKLLMDTVADAEGNFKFSGLDLPDPAKIIIRARGRDKSNKIIIHVNPPETVPVGYMLVPDAEKAIGASTLALMRHTYEEAANAILLKQVNIKGYKPGERDSLQHTDNKNGAGYSDAAIIAKNWESYTSLEDAIKAVIPGVYFENNVMYDLHSSIELTSGSRPPMSVVIDGVLIQGDASSQSTIFDKINPGDVYSIEILESSRFLNLYGSKASGGGIVITTKTGGENFMSSTARASGIITYPFQGFYKARTFYAPKFSVTQSAKATYPRTTIYWKPEVFPDKTGTASFDFLNGEEPGTYRVIIEGLDVNGNLGRAVYRYKVE